MSHSGVKLVTWLTILYHSGKTFEKWNTNLTNCVECSVAKKNHNFVSQCGNVCDLNHNLVPQCRKLWELSWILYHHVEISVRWITVLSRSAKTTWDLKNKFVSQCQKTWELNQNFVSQCKKSLIGELQVCLTMSRILWPECHKFFSKWGAIFETI